MNLNDFKSISLKFMIRKYEKINILLSSYQNLGILRRFRPASKQLENTTTQTRFEMVVVLCSSAMRTVTNDDNEELSVCWVRWADEPRS